MCWQAQRFSADLGVPVYQPGSIQLPNVVPFRDKIRIRQTPLSLFSVGRDKELLRLREDLIVSNSDLRVRSLTPEEAEAPARSSGARLWIFCSSIELPKLVYLACSIRRYSPASRLLLLKGSRPPGFEDSLFHNILSASADTIESFLDAVSSLVLAV